MVAGRKLPGVEKLNFINLTLNWKNRRIHLCATTVSKRDVYNNRTCILTTSNIENKILILMHFILL